jgi:hypothetical protein
MNDEKIGSVDVAQLKAEASSLKSGLGAVAWATLEMFKRGGMPPQELKRIQERMNTYFAMPSDDECNAILRVVEARLVEDKAPDSNVWYS